MPDKMRLKKREIMVIAMCEAQLKDKLRIKDLMLRMKQ